MDYNWTINGTASLGAWTRVTPAITMQGNFISNPGVDASGDCGGKAFVTGNNNAAVGADDIDDGYTMLTSPVFDLSGIVNPHIKYARWFYNGGGAGAVNDSLIVRITNGIQTVDLEVVTASTAGSSSWVEKDILLTNAIIPFTNNMKIIVYAVDAIPGHLVEAGFDHFRVEPDSVNALLSVQENTVSNFYPNPLVKSKTIHYNIAQADNNVITITDLAGRTVQSFNVNSAQGSLNINESQAAGTYMINVYHKGIKISTNKLVILGE